MMEKEKGGRRGNTGEGRRKKEDKRRGMHTVEGRKREKRDKRQEKGDARWRRKEKRKRRQETREG